MNHKCILQGYSILNILHMPMDHMLDSKFSFFFLSFLLPPFWVFMWKRVKKYSWLHSALFVILLCQLHLSQKKVMLKAGYDYPSILASLTPQHMLK